VPPVVDGHLTEICQPHHHVRRLLPYDVVATRAAIGLERSRGGHRSHLVVVTVRPGFHPTRNRQRRMRLLPTR
jgi:hypothetical protein